MRAILLCFILIIPFQLKAQSVDFDNSILWEIRNNKDETVSYILGTMHILDTTFTNFPIKTIQSLIDECEALCIEIPMFHNSSTKAFYDRNTYSSKKDSSLMKMLGDEYFSKLKSIIDSSKYLSKYKNSLDSVNPAILHVGIELERQISQTCMFMMANLYLDAELELYAATKGYERIYLETIEQQQDWLYLTDYTYREKIQKLIESIDRFLDEKPQIDIFKQYSEQDLSYALTDAYSDSIISIRNIGMAAKLDSLLRTKKMFVAIGSGHLPYKNGVINLLHQKGYTIKPYKIDLTPDPARLHRVNDKGRVN